MVADHTHIEWTDATWNPITGCSVVSAGCKHCYAMKLAGTRMRNHPSRRGLTIDTAAGPVWNGQVRLNEEWLDQPLRWRRPRRIFVCAHGDLFHESVPDEWIDGVILVMMTAQQHTFQVLTKRAKRMRDYLTNPDTVARLVAKAMAAAAMIPGAEFTFSHVDDGMQGLLLDNVWLGVSVENQAAADERIPLLLQTPAAVRWISAEPLLGPVDLSAWFAQLNWVVAGGESGTGARPMHPDWARSLRDQCAVAGVPFLFKQWGAWAPSSEPTPAFNRSTRDFETVPAGRAMLKVGKKAAGRLLDGVLHDAYPRPCI